MTNAVQEASDRVEQNSRQKITYESEDLIMCSTPKMPSVASTTNEKKEEIAVPTYADASVSKMSKNTVNSASALAGRDIRTSARGLGDEAKTRKKELLGE